MSGINLRFFLAWRDFRFLEGKFRLAQKGAVLQTESSRARHDLRIFAGKRCAPREGRISAQCGIQIGAAAKDRVDTPDQKAEKKPDAKTEQSGACDEPLVQ